MGILSKLFKRKQQISNNAEGYRVGGLEDFMSLIRVYYQASMAASIGISNLNALPDLRVFKQTLHVATVNNKLGVGEKSRCRKMLIDLYGLPESFFKEIDTSLKRHCRSLGEVQPYLFRFQGFTQELMMLLSNLMKWKFRLPSFMRSALRGLTERTVHDILTRTTWKDESVRRTCISVRKYQEQLGYTESWMTEFSYQVIMLVKKEPKASAPDNA